MNSVNSKNLTFLILLVVLIAIVFTSILIVDHNEDIIYTDLDELGIED